MIGKKKIKAFVIQVAKDLSGRLKRVKWFLSLNEICYYEMSEIQ